MKLKPLSEWYEDQEGVSPVIAVILMVAITVVLAAVVYTWASGLAETGGGGGTPASCSQGEGNFLQMQSDPPRQTARNASDLVYRMTSSEGTVYEGVETYPGHNDDWQANTTWNWSWSPGDNNQDISGGDSLTVDDGPEDDSVGNAVWGNGDRFDFAIRDNQGALVQCKFTWSA